MQADELSLAGLEHGTLERPGRQLVDRDRRAVQLDPALVDLAAPMAPRLAEALLQNRGKIDDAVRRGKSRLRHLLGRLVLPHNAREMLLAGAGAFRPVPACGDPARELELPLHRRLRMLAAADDELPPLR